MNIQDYFGVEFQCMEKIDANGPDADPAWQYMREELMNGGDIEWNFHKFLIDANGDAIYSWKDYTNPASDEITQAIESLLY